MHRHRAIVHTGCQLAQLVGGKLEAGDLDRLAHLHDLVRSASGRTESWHCRFGNPRKSQAFRRLVLDDAPATITVLGDLSALTDRSVALVGGRNASANGQRVAENLAAELAHSLVVVSGLARGIDAAAHTGALLAGRTVAAVAGGLDVPYPPEHADLQRRIAEAGAVVTEAPLGTAPQARHFPRRNRIIAGLALGVIVVEAALRSGSLITARLAQDAG